MPVGNHAESIPAKSGHEDSSNEKDMNESKGIPASLVGHWEMAIGFDLDGRLTASTSSKVARHQMKRERVLRNMLICFDSVYTTLPSRLVYTTRRQRKLWPKIIMAIDAASP